MAKADAPPNFAGIVTFSNVPTKGAVIAIASAETGQQIGVVETDEAGRFETAIKAGKYALAVTEARGFSWIEQQNVPDMHVHIMLSHACHMISGQVDENVRDTRINFERQSFSQGDTFVSRPHEDGAFAACLPDGQYRAFLTGASLSVSTKFDVPTTASLHLRGVPSQAIRQPPHNPDWIRTDIGELVDDIITRTPKIVGLGEATHGTAEFVTTRGSLTFELIKRANVNLLLFEFDAIAGSKLDDYIHGEEIDIQRAVADLGFWTTDTHEFLDFLRKLREYNATTSSKVQLWGIDIQNTTLPVEQLNASADELGISNEEQAILKLLVKRGKGIRDLSPAQRADIDALLTRLSIPYGSTKHELLVAVAARSLAIQLDYWTGDMETWLRKRRDHGMASLANFLVQQRGVRRSCLWAHDGHISRQPSELALGYHLSISDNKYYAVGSYIYKGSSRAVDSAAKIGVVSHIIPEAPSYTLEGAITASLKEADIAWLPLSHLSQSWKKWLETPRFVRELGAVYRGADDLMKLRNVAEAFDAIVVLRSGHDSSPTPTGIRVFKR